MKTRQVYVGSVPIGGGAPVSIQSMTNTDTRDVDATISQIHALEAAGCEIVRSSVYDEDCAEALKRIIPAINIPIVADIHFDHRLAIAAIEAGAAKIRINPGNIGSEAKVKELVACAKDHKTPIRIGVNGGSLDKNLLLKYGMCAEALTESALQHVHILEHEGFEDIIISLKSSNVPMMVKAYRLASDKTAYPLHLGVTEAGMGENAILKSAIGIGSLLLDGIGDTMRVSLTGGVTQEIEIAKKILSASGIRSFGAEIISCPTCGRTRVNLAEIVTKVNDALKNTKKAIKVAVMGCAVNGPGEAREADIGIAFGSINAVVFKHGEIVYSDTLPGVIDRFIADAMELANN